VKDQICNAFCTVSSSYLFKKTKHYKDNCNHCIISRDMTWCYWASRFQFNQQFNIWFFLYEHHFGSFFYVHVTREKLQKQCSYEKFVRKILMKFTTGKQTLSFDSLSKFVPRSYKYFFCFSVRQTGWSNSQEVRARRIWIALKNKYCWQQHAVLRETFTLPPLPLKMAKEFCTAHQKNLHFFCK